MLALPAQAPAAKPLPDGMAYATMLFRDGTWLCNGKRRGYSCDQHSRDIAARLLEDAASEAPGEYASPQWLRVGTASAICANGAVERWALVPGTNRQADGCETGVPKPPPTGACPDPDAEEWCAMKALKDAGFKLGVAINACNKDRATKLCKRDVREVAWHACAIKKADRGELFDYIFLDFAWQQKRALQTIVNLVRFGRHDRYGKGARRKCIQAGRHLKWDLVMTNDRLTPFWKRNPYPKRVWIHANHVRVLGGDPGSAMDSNRDGDLTDEGWYQRAIAASSKSDGSWNGPIIDQLDRRFIRRVYRSDPRGYPMLKLEMPSQTAKLAMLPPENQCVLIARWARAQTQNQAMPHWTIFPLFSHGFLRDEEDPFDDSPHYDSTRQLFDFPLAREPSSYQWQRARIARFKGENWVPPCTF